MSVLNTVLTSTLTKSRKKLIMASIKSNKFIAWQMANDRVEYEDGGRNITNPLTTGRNPNVTSYEYYDELPVAQTDEFDEVEYNWSRVAGTVIISDQEEDENKGEALIFKLMKGKMEVLEESIQEKFSEYAFGAGAGTDPMGLAATIPDDPTTGTLGGINRATETQWRTSAYDFNGGLDESNIEEAIDDIQMDLNMGNEKPDLLLMGRDMWRFYKAAVRDKTVVNISTGSRSASDRMIDLGFEGMKHNGMMMMYDEDCPVDHMYFINSKYLRYHILKHVNMKIKQLVAPWNVDALGKRVVWQGQFCMWKAHRTHAVAFN